MYFDAVVALERRQFRARIVVAVAAADDADLHAFARQSKRQIGQELTGRRVIGPEKSIDEPDFWQTSTPPDRRTDI